MKGLREAEKNLLSIIFIEKIDPIVLKRGANEVRNAFFSKGERRADFNL